MRLKVGTSTYQCDGMQRADILCTAASGKAAVFELKLGRDRLSPGAFRNRFFASCTHLKNGRLKGSMVSLLERNFRFPKDSTLCASTEDGSWLVAEPWWLVLRRSVWSRWGRQTTLPTRHARVVLIEDLVEAFGGKQPFNTLARSLLVNDPYSTWQLGELRD